MARIHTPRSHLSQPTHSRPTRLGYSVMLGALLLISTAFWQDHPYAAYLGCGLGICILFSILFTRIHTDGIHGRWLMPVAAHAGQYSSIGAELRLSNTHTRSSVPFQLYAWDARQDITSQVATIPGLAESESKIIWLMFFPKRGHIALPPLEIACDIPFGMIRSRCTNSAICNIIILPALGSIQKEFHINLENWLMQQQQSTAIGSDELMRLRPYQHGDSPRLVHWRASARARHLIVGLRSHMSDLHINLAVDSLSSSASSRRFERLISMAASIVHHAFQHGWSVALFGSFAPSNGLYGSRGKLMEALACLNSVESDTVSSTVSSTVTSNNVHDYIPEHQHCMVLSLDTHQESRHHCTYYTLSQLEELISLARERR